MSATINPARPLFSMLGEQMQSGKGVCSFAHTHLFATEHSFDRDHSG